MNYRQLSNPNEHGIISFVTVYLQAILFSLQCTAILHRLGSRDTHSEKTGWRYFVEAIMKKHVMAVYGNVSLERGYCNDCGRMAIIKNGMYQCCDGLVAGVPNKFERMSEPFFARKTPTKFEKDRILREQEDRCFYCSVQFGSFRFRNGLPFLVKIHWDHQLPFAYSQNNKTENFVAACHVCNGIKSSHIFHTVEEAQVYIASKRKSKGYDF